VKSQSSNASLRPSIVVLEGHGEDRSRIFQQASGTQFSADNIYFESRDAAPLPLPVDIDLWPRVSELDALEMGVHRSIVERGTAVPTYIQRDFDEHLSTVIAEARRVGGGFVLLLGDSTSGKSRSAYEALHSGVPDCRLANPNDEDGLLDVLRAIGASDEMLVVWLDDFNRHLIQGEAAVYQLIKLALNKRSLVVATMRADIFSKLITISAEGEEGRTHSTLDHILDRIEPIIVPRMWTPGELNRASDVNDARIDDAVAHAAQYGVSEYLAAGPKLLQELEVARSVGSHPRGAALVAAGVDLARAGFDQPIPLDLLSLVHTQYLTRAGGALLRPESLPDALAWAIRRRYGVTSLLLPTDTQDAYRAFDYLIDSTSRSASAPPVPDFVWDALASTDLDAATAARVAQLAAGAGRDEIAHSILTSRVESGDARAARDLAALLRKHGEEAQAESLLRSAADKDPESAVILGVILERRGDSKDAENLYRSVADNYSHGAFHLAKLLEKAGRVEEAEKWYSKAADDSDASAVSEFAQLLMGQERMEEAEAWLRERAETSASAANSLAILLVRTGRPEEGVPFWIQSAKEGPGPAAANLARWYMNNGDLVAAEPWARMAAESGLAPFMTQWARWNWLAGDRTEGEASLRRLSDAGDHDASVLLGEFLHRERRDRESVEFLKKAMGQVGVRTGYVAHLIGMFQYDEGDHDEAKEYLRIALDAGEFEASTLLADIAAEEGDELERIRVLRIGAEGGSKYAACWLGRALSEENPEEAEKFFSQSLDADHAHAGCNLGKLLWSRGAIAEAEVAFKKSIRGGHSHAAGRLSELMAAEHRGAEAAHWLRVYNGQIDPSRSRPNGAKKRRKRR
jgi:tetratricopeptide (TPR) repeat protein